MYQSDYLGTKLVVYITEFSKNFRIFSQCHINVTLRNVVNNTHKTLHLRASLSYWQTNDVQNLTSLPKLA